MMEKKMEDISLHGERNLYSVTIKEELMEKKIDDISLHLQFVNSKRGKTPKENLEKRGEINSIKLPLYEMRRKEDTRRYLAKEKKKVGKDDRSSEFKFKRVDGWCCPANFLCCCSVRLSCGKWVFWIFFNPYVSILVAWVN